MLFIRQATIADLEAIRNIYNECVRNGNATFDTEPWSMERAGQWFSGHGSGHPVFVGESEGKVLGWASLNRWSDKKAYDSTAEVSVYVDADARKKGIGKKLIDWITLAGESSGFHSLIARITEGNELSLHLFHSFGYEKAGTLKEAGHKFGRYWDVHFLQKVF